jgi:hypothetical protein
LHDNSRGNSGAFELSKFELGRLKMDGLFCAQQLGKMKRGLITQGGLTHTMGIDPDTN